jgi:hypothetical protein
MPQHASLFVEMGVLLTFCLGWPQTADPWISASVVSGFTGMCHHAQPFRLNIIMKFYVCIGEILVKPFLVIMENTFVRKCGNFETLHDKF